MLSIIVPTFNEPGNVEELARRVRETLADTPYEILFVDDSTDETPAVIERLADTDGRVRLHHRVGERGLASAAAAGFAYARGDVFAVMDADLQHPPEMLPEMLTAFQATAADVVVASRFQPGGDDGGLSPQRKAVSWVARLMGHLFLPTSLAGVTDPTSGFFMVRRQAIEQVPLRPIGWKILIEVLVRAGPLSVAEVPYRFRCRHAGRSKMSLAEEWNYLRHLARLMAASPADRRFLLFCGVGAFGVLVNMAVYFGLSHFMHVKVEVAGVTSATVAMLGNFALNNRYTWSDATRSAIHVRLVKYCLFSLVGIGVTTSVLGLLYYAVHVDYLLANLIGIACATVWNFWSNNNWTWEPTVKASPFERAS